MNLPARILLLVALAALLSGGDRTPAQTRNPRPLFGIIGYLEAQAYPSPATAARGITSFCRGQRVEILEVVPGFARVRRYGYTGEGWVELRFVNKITQWGNEWRAPFRLTYNGKEYGNLGVETLNAGRGRFRDRIYVQNQGKRRRILSFRYDSFGHDLARIDDFNRDGNDDFLIFVVGDHTHELHAYISRGRSFRKIDLLRQFARSEKIRYNIKSRDNAGIVVGCRNITIEYGDASKVGTEYQVKRFHVTGRGLEPVYAARDQGRSENRYNR